MGPGAEFRFAPAKASDLERLAALRVEAMRESLERIGRFDPERAYRRMADAFRPAHTRLILAGADLAGCVAFAPAGPGRRLLEHFYLYPAFQNRGLGGAVLAALLAEADAAGEAVELTVVRQSAAHGLYRRFGFVEIAEDGVDVIYRREPVQCAP